MDESGEDAGEGPPVRAPVEDALVRPLAGFGATLERRRPPLCPELELWLMGDSVDLEAGCAALADGEAPPYWAFCWGSGQALARHLLDHPELVAGREVVDLGCGSGIAGIAAARAGAARVLAVDVDPLARHAARLNARLNASSDTPPLETAAAPPLAWDLLLAADVLYETGVRDWVLGEARRRGAILLADPGRAGMPAVALPRLRTLEARTFPDVDPPQTRVTLFALEPRR